MANKFMPHVQGHLICAIDVETTGFIAGFHDLLQIAVLPLNSDLRPFDDGTHFNMFLQPKYGNVDPEAGEVHKHDDATIKLHAIDPDTASEAFCQWVYGLGLSLDKKLIPLAHNWQFDKMFVWDWLGGHTFNHLFHYSYRDSMIALNFLNDQAFFHADDFPFSKLSLKHLCKTLGVTNERAHDALADCFATAECYRRLCKRL